MITHRGIVLMESLHARLLTTVSQVALAGGRLSRFSVFDHRSLAADMHAANWHTETGLK